MKYKRYIIEFFGLSILMIAAMYYFNDQDLISSLLISLPTSLMTVINKFYLDKKTLKKKNSQKA